MAKFLLSIAVIFIVVFSLYQFFNKTGFKYGLDQLSFFRGSIKVSSPDFGNGDKIPVKFTCESQNVSPTLLISGVPDNSKSLAIVLEDSSITPKHFTHWLVFDINPKTRIFNGTDLSNSVLMGINDFGNFGYGGPCPGWGVTHRYYFRVYALDKMLNSEALNRPSFDSLIKGHTLATGILTGVYSKSP